jgi:methanogenic corrinoid protein MtbC1
VIKLKYSWRRGNAITKEFTKKIGVDYTALDAVDGIKICRRGGVGE